METINIISRGIACCKREPRGNNGLEGYLLGTNYMFERAENKTGAYIRVFGIPMNTGEIEPTSFTPPFSYETCGVGAFRKFFDIISEQSI